MAAKPCHGEDDAGSSANRRTRCFSTGMTALLPASGMTTPGSQALCLRRELGDLGLAENLGLTKEPTADLEPRNDRHIEGLGLHHEPVTHDDENAPHEDRPPRRLARGAGRRGRLPVGAISVLERSQTARQTPVSR
jgi:hypothetical protein